MRAGMTQERLIEELDKTIKVRPHQLLDTVDPQPHRDACHRHQKRDRDQGLWREPRRHRPHRAADRSRGKDGAGDHVRARRTAFGWALYRRRSTGPRRRDTASTSPMYKLWIPARSAARLTGGPSKDWHAIRSVSATDAKSATAWTTRSILSSTGMERRQQFRA